MKNVLFRGLTTLTLGTALASLSASCTKDLDQNPKYELTPDRQYTSQAGYYQVMAKLYAGFAVSGQGDPDSGSSSDISGIDAGTGNYLRQYWSAQELSTDEAVVAWNDPGIQDWHNMNWNASNLLINGLYNRLYYEISICNEFLRESTDEKLSARGITGDAAAAVRAYRADARFLRAVTYYHVIDLFGNGPKATETTVVNTGDTPPYATRKDLFNFVEAELLDCGNTLPKPKANQYGRVDQAAAWGFLARLYINAEVYTGDLPTANTTHGNGVARWADAAKYAKQAIDAGYNLANTPNATASAYGRLFLADNNTGPATQEIIWPIIYDVNTTRSYGGTTFLINGSTSPTTAPWQKLVGQSTGWGGLRGTSALVDQFAKAGGDTTRDSRGRFWITPPRRPYQPKLTDTAKVRQYLRITNLSDFTRGPGVLKFRNVNSAGAAQGGAQNFSSVDYPMLRAADLMLIYAEAVVRGGGDQTTAMTYVNNIRRRAYGDNSADVSWATISQLTGGQPEFLLDERSRELFWEGVRRTDLIRFRRFVENTYVWPWKGGVANGTGVPGFRELYPLPTSDLTVNPNLKQNAGY
ncbi:RagB/SusD family nutrient uptake outer membrane protein [Hymenobacter segetis]|uniref:RagB/SusD family nutrient uptake outer membrane protein n=1 Tax=Hymenobacter segetis TaxID=2025509 RepID=A0ABU9LSF9_9BACT